MGSKALGDLDIRFYLSVFLRRLPLVLAIVGMMSTIGVVIAFGLPPLYRASARILVEAPEIPTEMARSTVPTSAVEQFQIIQQEATTQQHLLDLAERLDVYGDRREDMTRDQIVDDMRVRTHFEQILLDAPQGGDRATIFGISFDAGEPALAAKVVNDLVSFILDKNTRLRAESAEITTQFFSGEVSRLGAELSRLEAEILNFKNDNKTSLPDSLDFRRSQQSSAQERLSQLEREEAATRSRRSNLVDMFAVTGQVANTEPVSPEQQLLQDLNRALSEQLTIFAETSPNIVALRARISTLQQGLQSKSAAKNGKTRPSELDLQLSEIDERLRFIGQEKALVEKNLAELTVSINATPENETRLNALERSRTNIQAQYNLATAKLAEASTGEQIEMRSKGSRFSLVEPATPPRLPIEPNRPRIMMAALLAGVGGSIGLVVLLELLNKTVRRPTDLTQLLQVQPLATIPYIYLENEKQPGFTRFVEAVLSRVRRLPPFAMRAGQGGLSSQPSSSS